MTIQAGLVGRLQRVARAARAVVSAQPWAPGWVLDPERTGLEVVELIDAVGELSDIVNDGAEDGGYDHRDPHHVAAALSNDLDYLEGQCPSIAETVKQARDLLAAWPARLEDTCPACKAGHPLTRTGEHHPGYDGRRFYACRKSERWSARRIPDTRSCLPPLGPRR